LLNFFRKHKKTKKICNRGTIFPDRRGDQVLAGISTASSQLQIAQRIVSEHLSVRQTEQLVTLKTKGYSAKPLKNVHKAFHNLEDQLRKYLGTKVHVKTGARGGQLVIHYYSDEELDRVAALILE